MKKYSLSFLFILFTSLLAAQSTAVSWTVKQQPGSDGTVELLFNAKIESNWYIYSAEKANGPIPTSVDFVQGDEYELIGSLTELSKTKEKYDEAFDATVKIFESEASFMQKIKVRTDKNFVLRGMIIYQSCSGSSCIYAEEEFEVQINGTAGASSSAAATADSSDEDGTIWMFLLIAFAAGLGSVFTPCVFPMIPMTVSFFLSGKQSKRAGIMRGLIFGASVTAIYTIFGLLAAVFKSADAADVLSTHWIPNLIFAAMFLIFALSFFGAFEITLPSGLANKADQKADSSGYFGSFFVAVALVIVSFSCTGPFVGSILVESMSSGVALKPTLGMLAFGLALSFPFVLFSFFPSLIKKMPKSGGWLNMVKVVFAFILLAFSLKYLQTIGLYFGFTLLSREVFIGIWITCAILLGLYFLGRLRLSHDSEVTHIRVTRLLFAIASFTFALYLLPGLFGAPLPAMSGIIPEPKGPSVFAQQVVAGDDIPSGQGLCDEAKYSSPNHKLPYGLPAYHDIQQALDCAKQQDKPVLLAFKFDNCSVCKKMEANVWSNDKVLDVLHNKVVIVTLYVDDKTELPEDEWVTSTIDGKVKKVLGRKLRDYQMSRFGVAAQPYYVLIGHNEEVLTPPVAESSVEEFLQFLNAGIDKYNSSTKPPVPIFTPKIKL